MEREGFAARPVVFRMLIAFWAAVLLVFTVVPILHCIRGHSVKDYFVWYEAGKAVLQGAEVYPPLHLKFPFMYPPPCAVFLAPLAALGQLGLIVVLAITCAAAWIASVLFSVRLATGSWRRAHPLVYAIPNFIVVVFVWGNFLLGQPSLLLLALMLGAFLLLQNGKQAGAGICVSLAAAIKAFPAVAIVYLVYRRHWLAALSCALSLAFLLIVLPAPVRGLKQARQDLSRWSNGMLFKYDENGVAQRAGRSNSWRNQSIWGLSNRMLRHIESDPAVGPHKVVFSNIADLSFRTVNVVILTAAALLGLVYVAVLPHKNRRTRNTDAIEFALLLLLILMFTPLSFGYLFAWLLYPFTVVVSRALRGGSRRLVAIASMSVALLALTIPFRIGAQTYGNIFFATLLLFVALSLELWDEKRRVLTAISA